MYIKHWLYLAIFSTYVRAPTLSKPHYNSFLQ